MVSRRTWASSYSVFVEWTAHGRESQWELTARMTGPLLLFIMVHRGKSGKYKVQGNGLRIYPDQIFETKETGEKEAVEVAETFRYRTSLAEHCTGKKGLRWFWPRIATRKRKNPLSLKRKKCPAGDDKKRWRVITFENVMPRAHVAAINARIRDIFFRRAVHGSRVIYVTVRYTGATNFCHRLLACSDEFVAQTSGRNLRVYPTNENVPRRSILPHIRQAKMTRGTPTVKF